MNQKEKDPIARTTEVIKPPAKKAETGIKMRVNRSDRHEEVDLLLCTRHEISMYMEQQRRYNPDALGEVVFQVIGAFREYAGLPRVEHDPLETEEA